MDNPVQPIVLVVLDGWGMAPASKGNAVFWAKTPNFDSLWNAYPHTQLEASGEAVGLPRGEFGNSEAGHINLGSGTIVFQSLPRINMSIADGSFYDNKSLKAVISHLKKNNSSLHLMGLIGSGGVHSNIEHLYALLYWAKKHNLTKVFLHLFTDGRDSPPTSSIKYIRMVELKIKQYQIGKIASIMGRFYAMDRDNRWNRIETAYQALTEAKGKLTDSYAKTIEESYKNNKTDEFIEPIIITNQDKPTAVISDNDAVIFFNFRIDRPRELTKAFVLPHFENMIIKKAAFDPYAERYGKRQYQDEEIKRISTFKRNKVCHNLLFVTMTEYEPGLPVMTIMPPTQVNLPVSRILSQKGWRQLHISETEKARHVTYYYDGNREDPFPGEDWVVIPSPKVRTYDQKPEMSAFQITEEVLKRLNLKMYNFILINFANPDMVGHSGVLKAGIKACEVVDQCLGKIVNATVNLGGTCLVTADHGNVEEMLDLKTGEIDTKHSNNPVPFILIQKKPDKYPKLQKGILADVGPTILKLANITRPTEFTGKSLI